MNYSNFSKGSLELKSPEHSTFYFTPPRRFELRLQGIRKLVRDFLFLSHKLTHRNLAFYPG